MLPKPNFHIVKHIVWITAFFKKLLHTTAPQATILIRIMVGGIFLSEGIQKFLFFDALGRGQLMQIDTPLSVGMLILVAILEMDCGIFILCGFFTRVATIPLIIDISVAIATTKIPILLKNRFWSMVYEARTDFSLFLALIFLLIVGAGPWSIDADIIRKKAKPAV